MRPSEIQLAVAKSKLVIEPNTVCFVRVGTKTKLKGNLLISPLENSSFFQDQIGLTSPNLIVKSNKNLVVPIFNETHKRFLVKKGMTLAVIEPFKEPTQLNESNKVEDTKTPPSNLDKHAHKINDTPNTSSHEDTQTQQLNFHKHTNKTNGSIFNCINMTKIEEDELDSTEISSEIKWKFKKLLQDKKNVFAQNELDLGLTHLTEAQIDTGDSPPIKQRMYRTPFSQYKMLEKTV